MGTCSACATSRALASQIAVEKSRLEFRICEYAVRSIASPISCTIASSRCWITDTVMRSIIRCSPHSLSGVLALHAENAIGSHTPFEALQLELADELGVDR